jgi:hypothetical protein
MSATATERHPSEPTLDISGTSPVPFSRLTRVELRKMLDTRGGFWLLLLTVVLLVLVTVVVLLVTALSDATGAPSLMDWVQILSLPLSVLLPVFPILSVTSEWGQRTALVTFSLEPHRIKVLTAKLAAVVALAAGTIVVAGLLGLVATPVAAALDGSSPVWEVDWSMLGFTLLVQLLYFLMAFALGAALLNSPGAISAFYVMGLLVPMMVYSTLYALFGWAQDVIPWIDLQFASAPFVSGMETNGTEVAQFVVASLLWIVVPLAFGVRRLLRTEVK